MNGGITAIIPVKSKSSRLENKNILPFGDSNLLIHKIRQLINVGEIDEIIVSSDSDVMLEMAIKEGVKAIKRPIKYANESQPFGYFLEYICGIMNTDNLLWACCTSPLLETQIYEKAINLYRKKLCETYDSLISVQKFQHFLLDETGPMNFKRGLEHKNSQDLPLYHCFTCGIIMAPKKSVYEWKYHFGPNVYRMEVTQSEAIDIDTYEDYLCAKVIFEHIEKQKKL